MTKERRIKQMNESTGGSYHPEELPLREAKVIGAGFAFPGASRS
ncbi:hypothetical protein [Bacillus sp. FJAT-27238]|nr:hypothetical protein [Bacillus sp. FJAT-27238]